MERINPNSNQEIPDGISAPNVTEEIAGCPTTVEELDAKLKTYFLDGDISSVTNQEKENFLANVGNQNMKEYINSNYDYFDFFWGYLELRKYEQEEIEKLIRNLTLRINEVEKNRIEARERKINNPTATEEEYIAGTYREAIETQVRDAVFELQRKGYKPWGSGFDNLAIGTQVIWIKKDGVNVDELKKYLPKYVFVKESMGDAIEIGFYTLPDDTILHLKEVWDDIVSKIPENKNKKTGLTDNGLQGVDFRQAQDNMKAGKNTWLGSNLAFVDGKVVEMSYQNFQNRCGKIEEKNFTGYNIKMVEPISENYIPHSGNERPIDLDHLDDIDDLSDLPLNDTSDTKRDVLGDFDILRGQLDPDDTRPLPSTEKLTTEHLNVVEKLTDEELGISVNSAIDSIDYDGAYELASKIESETVLHNALNEAVSKLIDKKEFSIAKKFIRLIHNMDVYTSMLNHILDLEENYNSSPQPLVGTNDVEHKIKIKKVGEDKEPKSNEISEIISDEDFDSFVKTGEVPGDVLVNIADRMAKGEKITEREVALYEALGEKIELLLKDRKGVADNLEEEVKGETPEVTPADVEAEIQETDRNVEEEKSATPEVVPSVPEVVEEPIKVEKTEATPEEIEQINLNLENARAEYASQMIDWKNKIREKKSKFRKVLQDLGVDKQLPDEEEPAELVEARRVYIEAKKTKNKNLVGVIFDVPNKVDKPLGLMQEEMTSRKQELFSAVEKEYAELQKRLEENLPPLEKGMMGKAFDKWIKMNKYQRIAVSSGVLAIGGFAFGMSFGAAATYGGYRVGRAVLGAIGAQGTGKITEAFYNKKNEKARETVFEDYAKQINLENFEQKEKEMMAFLDKEKDEKKRQILKKGLVMAATAGVANIGMNLSDATTGGNFGGSTNNTENLASNTPKITTPENLAPGSSIDKLEQFKPSISEIKPEVDSILETKVELSSKGFLQDMHNLKANIMAEYGGEVPDSLKPIMDKTPMELAKAFHFYDPENNASGLGFKGESLGLDSDGNIYYEHLKGDKQILFDAKTGNFNHFDGTESAPSATVLSGASTEVLQDDPIPKTDANSIPKMSETKVGSAEVLEGDPILKTETVSVLDVKDTTDEEIARQSLSQNKVVEIPEEEPIIMTDESVIPVEVQMDGVSKMHIPVENGKYIDVFSVGENNFVSYDGMRIGQEGMINGYKAFVLDDAFQDGEQYSKVRSAFVKAFEADVKTDVVGPNPIAESFEGGKIYITYNVPSDPNSVRVLLNGKEIAVGNTTVVDGNGIPKMKMHGELKGGWFLVDNAYERAFKHINKMIKVGNFNFSK